jgi:integrase
MSEPRLSDLPRSFERHLRAELVGLRVEDLDFEHDVARVIGKGRRERALPFGHPRQRRQWGSRHALTRRRRQLIEASPDRAWNRAERACAVCAPPTVEPRTPRTPL